MFVRVVGVCLLVLICAGVCHGARVRRSVAGYNNKIQPLNVKTRDDTGRQHDVSVSEVPLDKKKHDIPSEPLPVNEQFPSAVLFGRTCGGTIISPTWILTAGHCTLFTGGREVLAGTNNTADGSGVRIRVKRLVIHPLFSVGPYWLDAERYNIKQVAARWDFLLAELENPLPINGKTIVAAKLDDQLRLPPGQEVGYAGFGAKHHGETMRQNMHGMDLEILSDDECAKLEQYNSQDMLCATGRPPRYDSACNGDSGSGLVVNGKVVGVASWVEDDAFRCFNGAKVVFSRVAAARDWIRQVTRI